MTYSRQLRRLVDSVENHDVRLSRDETVKVVAGKLHVMRVVSTKPGKSPPYLTALVLEYEDGVGYELFLPSDGRQITADVERLCGLAEGEGTLVD